MTIEKKIMALANIFGTLIFPLLIVLTVLGSCAYYIYPLFIVLLTVSHSRLSYYSRSDHT